MILLATILLHWLLAPGAMAPATVIADTPGQTTPPAVARCDSMHLELGHVPGRLQPIWELLCDP